MFNSVAAHKTVWKNHSRHGITVRPIRIKKYWQPTLTKIIICLKIISNHWMRLSRIWRILAIKEVVIHRGRRLRWITPSEICRILHILRKPNSLIALLFIQNISSFLNEFCHYALCFPLTKYNTTLSPGFLGQQFNNLQRAALLMSFCRPRCNNFRCSALMTSLIQYGEDSFQIWWTAAGNSKFVVCGFNQTEMGKYFEWIIISIVIVCTEEKPELSIHVC